MHGRQLHLLEFLNISAVDLANAYCIAGCDDIEVTLKGVGIKKALPFIKTNELSIESLSDAFEKFEREKLEILLEEILDLWLKLDITFPTYHDSLVVYNHTSMISSFVSRLDDDGRLRRPGLYSLHTAKVRIISLTIRSRN